MEPNAACVVCTGTLTVARPTPPSPSETWNVTVYVPAAAYGCEGVKPVAVAPSPKFHVIVYASAVSASLKVPLKFTVSPAVVTSWTDGVKLMLDTLGATLVAVTVIDLESDMPLSSDALNVTR